MSISIENLGITQLSVAQRLELIEQIWDSLPEDVTPEEVPASHVAELRNRLGAQNKPGVGKPWSDVLDSLEGKS